MEKISPVKATTYDFEERSRKFAKDVNIFLEGVPWSMSNNEYSKQLIRSSGSVGANYIEAGEALSKKDCIKHMRIARKEAKESIHWILLIKVDPNNNLIIERNRLAMEAKELVCILSAMLNKLT